MTNLDRTVAGINVLVEFVDLEEHVRLSIMSFEIMNHHHRSVLFSFFSHAATGLCLFRVSLPASISTLLLLFSLHARLNKPHLQRNCTYPSTCEHTLKRTENGIYPAVFLINSEPSVYLSKSSTSSLSNFSHTSTSWFSENFANMAVLNASRLDCCNNNRIRVRIMFYF